MYAYLYHCAHISLVYSSYHILGIGCPRRNHTNPQIKKKIRVSWSRGGTRSGRRVGARSAGVQTRSDEHTDVPDLPAAGVLGVVEHWDVWDVSINPNLGTFFPHRNPVCKQGKS